MVNYFIYSTDDSYSTNGMDYFNAKGLDTLKNFKDEVRNLQNTAQSNCKDDRIVYLHWSCRCVEVKEEEVTTRYTEKNGNGSDTLPHTVLDWITENVSVNDTIELLYVITDGAVDISRTKPCDPNLKINIVNFFAFNSDIRDIDMSVASMFICNNKRYIVHCNEDLVDETDLSNPFDYDQITIENFHDKKNELKSYIKLQFLTKSSSDTLALEEIKKLKRLETRLCNKLQDSEEKPTKRINLNVKDKDSFIEQLKSTMFYKTLMNPCHYKEKQSIASCINTLVNYINNDKKSFRFDNLKFSKKFTMETEEEVFNINYKAVEEIPFPDIIMDNESGVPVILITHYSLMENILFKPSRKITVGYQRFEKMPHPKQGCRAIRLHKAAGRMRQSHFSRFRRTVECPMILINDQKFKQSIEYYYNLDAFKSMVEHGIRTGPRTRKRFTGAIVPLEEFDDYNDYILACTYFDRRRVSYNKGLLYYVLYKTCEKLEYIEPNVVSYLKGYVIKRIAKTKCYLNLSRVSVDNPLIKVDLTTALWYCLELSSAIFKNEPKHFTKEMTRLYSSYAEYMKEILEWFQYDIDTKSVDLRTEIFRHVNRLKRIPRIADKTYFILEQIFKKEDGFLIAEIVNPDNIYKLNYLQMNHNKIIDEDVLNAAVDVHKFAHFMDYVDTNDVQICLQTMRPYFVLENKKSFYEQVVNNARKVLIRNGEVILESVDKMDFTRTLSANKLYISYVHQHTQFPTIEEYKKFVLDKKRYFNGKPVIFATNTLDILGTTFASYDKIINDANELIDVTKFMELTKSSVNRKNRIKKENPPDFNMDEIPNYLEKSESNVTSHKEVKEKLKIGSKRCDADQPKARNVKKKAM